MELANRLAVGPPKDAVAVHRAGKDGQEADVA